MATPRYSCALRARELGEPRYGTASTVHRWILLEEPGPWGRDAIIDSRLDPAVARALKARARGLGARPILIRRHGGRRGDTRSAFVVSSQPQGSWAERFTLPDAAALLDLDLAPLTDHASCGGDHVSDALLLVCTNGRHDVCCAEFGRPLAQALDAVLPEQTWECSHIGGDRFAGNLVCLPQGLYYGHVGPEEGPRVAAEHADGRIALEHYRGRSSYSFLVQAAEFFVRRAHSLRGIDEVLLERLTPQDAGRTRVRFAVPDGQVEVDVETTASPEPQQLTCSANVESTPPRYRVVSIDPEPGS